MQALTISGLLALGVVLVVASVVLRVYSGGRYEIKTTDTVFLVVPLLLVALATGKIKGLDLFGVKADLSELWSQAAQTKIERQVTQAVPATVQDAVRIFETAPKGGVGEIQRLIDRKVEALEFKLEAGVYNAQAIKTYFDALSGSSHLRFIVVDNPDGSLFGVYNANDLIAYLRLAGQQGYEDLQRMLNGPDQAVREKLAKLPGFVSEKDAVTRTTTKRDALARMEQRSVDSLPVVNEARGFVGAVERTKLTTSLILAVTDKLESR